MNYTLGFTPLFRRSLLDFSEYWNLSRDHKETNRQERMGHDQWIYFLASVFGSIVRIDQLLTSYRQHDDNRFGYAVPSWFQQLTWSMFPSFDGRAEQFAALESGACSRAAILEQLTEALTGEWRRRAVVAAEKYRQLELLYHGRRRLYEAPSLIDRAAAIQSILEQHGYRAKRKWGLGSKALVSDLLLGLPVGHRLSRPRSTSSSPAK
jgi:hypothetical protein